MNEKSKIQVHTEKTFYNIVRRGIGGQHQDKYIMAEAGMASPVSGMSGLALRDDRDDVESSKQWHSGSTLESYVLPTNLRIDDNETNLALSCMEVIKVSKVSRDGCCKLTHIQTHISCYIHTIISKFTPQNLTIYNLERQATNASLGNIFQPSFHLNHLQSSPGESEGTIKKKCCRS